MTTQNTNTKRTQSASPGYQEISVDEVLRADGATHLAQQNITLESKALQADRHLGIDTTQQERRLDAARLDLDHAEAFQTALENGEL